MQKSTFPLINNLWKGCALFFFIQFAKMESLAQTYIGYHSSPYAGVYAVVTSPADILNHRVRGDVKPGGYLNRNW